MIRPAAKAALSRWAEALIGAAITALGMYWAFFTGGGLLHWVGYAVAALGLVIAFAGLQRARFRSPRNGPGVVMINEQRISYFGPLSGGMVDLEALGSLAIDHGAEPAQWVLSTPGQGDLLIPLGAKGADALFDIFAQLPELKTEHLLRKMNADTGGLSVIWRSADVQKSIRALH